MVKLKHLLTVVKFLLLVVLMLGIFTAVWLRQGEKSLNWAAPYIAQRFNGSSDTLSIGVGDVTINWHDLSTIGMLRVKNVSIAGRDGAVFATLPEMYVGLDLFGFLPNRHSLNSILIRQPKLFLTRGKDRVLRLGLQGSDTATPIDTLVGNSTGGKVKPWDGRLPFRHLQLEHVNLVVSDEITGTKLTSPDAYFKISRTYGRYHVAIHMPFADGKEKGDIDVSMQTPQWGHHVLDARLVQVPMDYACLIASCPEGMDFTGKLDSHLRMGFDAEMQPQNGTLTIDSKKLVATAPTWFPEPLVAQPAHIALAMNGGLSHILLNKLDLALEDTHINGSGEAALKKDGWYVDGKGSMDKLAIEKLYKYWPITLAPDSRTWVTSSMRGGYGENSTIAIHLTPKDFTNDTIADSALSARVNARNITVHYLPGFPDLAGVNGTADFTGTTITVNGTSGTMLTGTTVSKSHLYFSDLNKAGTPMETEINLKAPAADAATLLQLPMFTFDDSLQLNPATLQGTIAGVIKLKFDAFSGETPGATPVAPSEVDFSHVIYDINTTLSDIAQPKFAGKLDITGAGGTLTATNDGMHFTGSVSNGDAALNVNVSQKSGEDVLLGLDGTIARKQFTSLGLPDDNHFGDGNLGVKAELVAKKDTLLLRSAVVDMKDIAFAIPEISWSKKRGAESSITLTPRAKDYGLEITGPGLSVPNASLALSDDLDLQSLILPRVKTANSDFGLRYQHGKKGYEISLTGDTIDMSQSYNSTSTSTSENTILKNFPAIALKLDLGALVLMPKAPLTDVKGNLDCSAQRCESADISAAAGDGDVSLTINKTTGTRQFLLTASNAGDFLRALDITDRMYGGKLNMKGDYDDSITPPALAAKLYIGDFTLKNSEILGRILSIGSLSGLQNALTGKGIAFDKLSSDIYSRAGMITVNDGKASGNALGITLGGTVDTAKSRLNLKGTLAPAYALNSAISDIPLIGYLAGGKEGLIAFNYSVKGPYSDPNVSVNPLSGLTPGFLRGIWGSTQPENPVKEREAKGPDADAQESADSQ